MKPGRERHLFAFSPIMTVARRSWRFVRFEMPVTSARDLGCSIKCPPVIWADA